MKDEAIKFLESVAHLENDQKIEFIQGSEPYNVHQGHVEICRWLIGVLQGGIGHFTKSSNGSLKEEEWIRIK